MQEVQYQNGKLVTAFTEGYNWGGGAVSADASRLNGARLCVELPRYGHSRDAMRPTRAAKNERRTLTRDLSAKTPTASSRIEAQRLCPTPWRPLEAAGLPFDQSISTNLRLLSRLPIFATTLKVAV